VEPRTNIFGFQDRDPDPGFVKKPVMHVPLEQWQLMTAFVQTCPVEICGYGLVDQIGLTTFLVEKAYILDQNVGEAHARVDKMVIGQHQVDLERQGIDSGRIRLQWHSHGHGGAYVSPIDLDNIENYPGDEWMISLVLNKRGEFAAQLDVFKPFRVWTPVKVVVDLPIPANLARQAQRDIRAKVRQPNNIVGSRAVRPALATSPTVDVDAAAFADPNPATRRW
jgi:proteasome lid subunit RPN8/RPN11